jgi:hypothetical protein
VSLECGLKSVSVSALTNEHHVRFAITHNLFTLLCGGDFTDRCSQDLRGQLLHLC